MNEKVDAQIKGLSTQEVLSRLEQFGHNEIQAESSNNLWNIFLASVREPMVLLLIGIGFIYWFLGEGQEVYSLASFLVLILGITIYQENKTERTLQALKNLSSPRAIVIRDNNQLRIPGRDLVPDDIVILSEGDRIPADIVLLKGGPLSIDESIITGESVPVDKSSLRNDIALSGTLILKGQALGKVVQTGSKTEIGKIGKSLEEKEDQGTPLQVSARRTVGKLSILVTIITLFVILSYWLTRNDLINGILVGLTLAMAILPNELPAVLLIFLAAGAWRISKRNVLTRKIPAVEALGSITYLCVDKTGTLTQNKMILKTLWNGKERLQISTSREEFPESFHEIMEFGILASPRNSFDPMEEAIQSTGHSLLERTEHLHPYWRLSREYQISDELLAVSYAWEGVDKAGYTIGAKGAVEAIIDLCHLSPEEAKVIETEMSLLASEGLRVLAVAKSASKILPGHQHDLNFEFLGLVGFEDPVREDVKISVQECQVANIRILMITGDHPETAKSIARQIGLENSKDTLTGHELKEMTDQVLKERIKEVQIYCRMKPLDKLRVVSLLQENGEVVAMTGDGVNDAPALKKAQIGIAMGKRGTDVAREAASIVLLDDSFSSIVAAIRTGRRVYQNLQKALSYLLSIHVTITLLSVLPVVLKLPLIFLPIHIAFLHLIIEPASTILFEALPASSELMQHRPREKNARLLSKSDLFRSLATGLIISIPIFGAFIYSLQKGLPPTDVRGNTFTTLILSNLILIFIMNRKQSARENGRHFKILAFTSLCMMVAVLYVPFFRQLFMFGPLHIHDFLFCMIITALSIILIIPLYSAERVFFRRK